MMARNSEIAHMDDIDRLIINTLQDGFPICEEPYARVAADLKLEETDLIGRLERLRSEGILSRFGPLYNAERMGGGLSLCAIKVPERDYDRITEIVNGFPEVAHNYAREHDYNMWFVLATETPEGIDDMVTQIAEATGLPVMNAPKLAEFSISLRFEA